VRKRHLNELGAILTELIPIGLQGCIGPRTKVTLLMADYFNSLHGMARTRLCSFLYQTIASGSEVSIVERRVERQA
jgi:hypothetical protein